MRRRWIVALLPVVVVGLFVPDLYAYRFLGPILGESSADAPDGYGGGFRMDGYSDLVWDPELWPPGETAVVALVDDPRWYESEVFDNYADLSAFVQKWGLDPWTSVPTADIKMELVRVASDEPFPEDVHLRVESNYDYERSVAYVSYGIRGPPGGVEHIHRCRIDVGTERELTDPMRRQRRRERLKLTLMHEMGHCLGLGHTGNYRDEYYNRTLLNTDLSRVQWHTDPIMSYGRHFIDNVFRGGVWFDDRVGASLLRPRAGWLETTGDLWGQVTLSSGAGASVVAVLASQPGPDGRMREPVVVVTDMRGYFAMAGLPPGDYFLEVTIVTSQYQPDLHFAFEESDYTEIRNALFTSPYRVRAGASTGPVLLTVQEHVPENIRR